MAKSIVIYTSKRGSTRQYAEWIAEDLGCEAFDKFAKMLDDELMQRLIVYGVGFADETAENYAQVWGYSLGKIDPKNEHRVLMYILGGRYDPAAVTGLDKFLMKTMRTVLLSGSTNDAKSRANMMKDRIDNGCDLVKRENIASLVKDAKKKVSKPAGDLNDE